MLGSPKPGQRRTLADKLVATLTSRRGEWVTRDELLEALYADHATGGPDWSISVLAQVIHHLRAKGVQIEGTHAYRMPSRRDSSAGDCSS